MSMFSYTNPANAAMPYLQQVPGTITPYYQPYINAGSTALANLMQQYGMLINNPTQIMSNIGSNYTQSPGYQYNYNQSMNAQNNAAAAGGYAGTPAAQEGSAQVASNLANQDYDNFMKQGEQLYETGLHGESDINHMGYNASNELAQSLANNLMSEGSLAYSGAANENAHNASELGAATSLASALLTGGMSMPFNLGSTGTAAWLNPDTNQWYRY